MNSNNSYNTGLEKSSLGEQIWRFVRFSVVTGMIFAMSFLVLNFSAYKTIFMGIVNPDAHAKAQEALEASVGESTPAVDPSLLLPVRPEGKDLRTEISWVDIPVVPTDNRLVIPKLGKSVPLVNMSADNLEGEDWHELEEQIQEGLRDGIVHYPGTAKPGEFGNVFLTGHSSYYPWDPGKFKDVFATLGQLEVGDRYYVYYDQRQFIYEIVDKKEVNPNDVGVLAQPTDQRISTLMTCSPVGTTLRRLILTAEQVS